MSKNAKWIIMVVVICVILSTIGITVYHNFYRIPNFAWTFHSNLVINSNNTHELNIQICGDSETDDTMYIVGAVSDIVYGGPKLQGGYVLENRKIVYFVESKRDKSKSVQEQNGIITAKWIDDNIVEIDGVRFNPFYESYDYRRK